MKNLTFKLMNILILIALALPIFAQNATGTIE
jgi:hypothetical protein